MVGYYQEALFNLQFFNPYLKGRSLHSYSGMLKDFKNLSSKEKNNFIKSATELIEDYKTDILYKNKDKKAKKIMPLMHLIMFMLTYFLCKGKFKSQFLVPQKRD